MKNFSEVTWTGKAVTPGKPGQVPQALAGLVSPDEEVRNRSYWQLDNEVVLQSDLFEAAYFVIPFLLQYLDEKVPYGRDRVYDLLYEIANGYAPSTVLCQTSEGDEIPLQAACDRELMKGMHIFLRDAADANSVIREKAMKFTEMQAP